MQLKKSSVHIDQPIVIVYVAMQLAIYHYATRSKEEFQDKVDRGPAHGLLGKTWEFFKAIDKLSTETCLDAIRQEAAR